MSAAASRTKTHVSNISAYHRPTAMFERGDVKSAVAAPETRSIATAIASPNVGSGGSAVSVSHKPPVTAPTAFGPFHSECHVPSTQLMRDVLLCALKVKEEKQLKMHPPGKVSQTVVWKVPKESKSASVVSIPIDPLKIPVLTKDRDDRTVRPVRLCSVSVKEFKAYGGVQQVPVFAKLSHIRPDGYAYYSKITNNLEESMDALKRVAKHHRLVLNQSPSVGTEPRPVVRSGVRAAADAAHLLGEADDLALQRKAEELVAGDKAKLADFERRVTLEKRQNLSLRQPELNKRMVLTRVDRKYLERSGSTDAGVSVLLKDTPEPVFIYDDSTLKALIGNASDAERVDLEAKMASLMSRDIERIMAELLIGHANECMSNPDSSRWCDLAMKFPPDIQKIATMLRSGTGGRVDDSVMPGPLELMRMFRTVYDSGMTVSSHLYSFEHETGEPSFFIELTRPKGESFSDLADRYVSFEVTFVISQPIS